jgi:phage terminase large subunit-like protein
MDEKNQEIIEKVLAYKLEEHPTLPSPNKRQRLEMIENIGPEKVLDLFLMRENKIKAELNDPMRYGHELPHWPDADKLLGRYNELVVLGGNRCLAGETVLTDAKTGKKQRIDAITEPFWVKAMDDSGREVVCQAEVPFTKDPAPLYKVETSYGVSFACSAAHLLLCADGEWRPLGLLPVGSQLYPAPSSSASCQPKWLQGVQRWSRKALGFLGDCLGRCHSYGERLLRWKDSGQAFAPLQGDAFAHESSCESTFHWPSERGSSLTLSKMGDWGSTQECSQTCQSSPGLSSSCGLLQSVGRFADTLCRASCRLFELASLECQVVLLSIVGFFLRLSIGAFSQLGRCAGFSLGEIVFRTTYLRNDIVWDFTVPVYHNYSYAGINHHNSGKTEYAAKRMAQAFIGTDLNGQAPDWVKERHGKRNIRIWCLHTTHMTSVSAQQNVFYKYLPPEIRNIKRTNHTQISFSQKNGFSDNTAVYMGNQIWFLNYAQDIKVVEGGEVDYVWCDELVPQNWLETLRYRLVTRSGKLIVTFTPVQGYTQVVKEYINSAKVTATRKSPLLPNNNVLTVPKGEMPYQAENLYGRHACIWYHTELNPYNNWERMKQELSGRSSHDIKIRAYGWADQTAGSEFPMFGDHNLWKGDAEEVIPEGSNYMAIDPAGARNWFMLWARVDKHGILWVYREWPDQSYGEWALPSDKPDGRAGPAQKAGAGRGVNEYTELIWSLETAGDKREMIVDRWIDPRTAGTETITKDGGVTVLDLLSQADNPLIFTPAAALPIEERVLLINDLLSWDREKPMGKGVNHPKLMIHESCQNLIYSLKEWTGQDGQKGASKDPIDALGYMVVMQPAYFGGLDWEKQSKRMSMTGSY